MDNDESSSADLHDLTLVCQQCGTEFDFTEREQLFFREMGFVNPRYCLACRKARKSNGNRHEDWKDFYDVTCAKCGVQTTVPFKPVHGRPVYCRNCLTEIREASNHEKQHSQAGSSIATKDRMSGFGLSVIDDAERPYEHLDRSIEALLDRLF